MPQPCTASRLASSRIFVIQVGRSAEWSFSNSSEGRADRIVTMVSGVTLSLPRYQSAARASPAGSPANWSRRWFEVWISLIVVLPIRIERLDALVWNTDVVGACVVSQTPRSFGAVNLDLAIVPGDDPNDHCSKTPGSLANEPAFPGTDEDAARQALDLALMYDTRSARSTALRGPCSASCEVVNGLPLGNF